MSQSEIEPWIQQIRTILNEMAPPRGENDSKTPPYYELGEELGHGGMGAVFLATLQPLGVLRALKVFRMPTQTNEDGVEHAEERFLREARIMGNLRHPAAVKALDYQSHYNAKYELWIFIYAMEACLVEETELSRICASYHVPYTPELEAERKKRHGSVSLQTFLDTGCVFPERTVARFARELVDVLRSAHEQGIVHRDVKPSNILIGPDGRLRLTDFGISKMVSAQTDEESFYTPSENGAERTISKGTAGYAAPEQWQGDGNPITEKADYYSLGVVLYQLLTREKPDLEQRWQDPSTLAKGISLHWDILLRGMLIRFRDNRLANPDLLDYEFAEIEEGRG